MVRERVGDWRLARRFALAGLVAGVLVISFAQTGLTRGTFDAAHDRLFSAPRPDSRITLVAIDQVSADNLGGYPLVSNTYHARVIVDEMPGLQLKGKSAETLRILKVTAIREDTTSPWVPMPTVASAAYSAKKDLYVTQSVFA